MGKFFVTTTWMIVNVVGMRGFVLMCALLTGITNAHAGESDTATVYRQQVLCPPNHSSCFTENIEKVEYTIHPSTRTVVALVIYPHGKHENDIIEFNNCIIARATDWSCDGLVKMTDGLVTPFGHQVSQGEYAWQDFIETLGFRIYRERQKRTDDK